MVNAPDWLVPLSQLLTSLGLFAIGFQIAIDTATGRFVGYHGWVRSSLLMLIGFHFMEVSMGVTPFLLDLATAVTAWAVFAITIWDRYYNIPSILDTAGDPNDVTTTTIARILDMEEELREHRAKAECAN